MCAQILTCIVGANEMRQKSGMDACTSKECIWLPPACDVSVGTPTLATITFRLIQCLFVTFASLIARESPSVMKLLLVVKSLCLYQHILS